MNDKNRQYAGIAATASYVPEHIRTNEDLEKMVDTSDEWIQSRSGIKERRIAEPGEKTSDLAIKAIAKLLEEQKLPAEEVDLLILATMSGDRPVPATATAVSHALGMKNAGALDISAACSGYIYGLSIATQYIMSGQYRNVIVVGAEVMSRIVDWTDRSTCVLFGDGAAAALIRPTDGPRAILSTYLRADGFGRDLLTIPAGGVETPATSETVAQNQHYLKMAGREIFKWAVGIIDTCFEEALARCETRPEKIDWIVPHQANIRILRAAAKRMKVPDERLIINLDRYGNTSAAALGIALDEAARSGKFKSGDHLALVAFGAGLTYASAIVRW